MKKLLATLLLSLGLLSATHANAESLKEYFAEFHRLNRQLDAEMEQMDRTMKKLGGEIDAELEKLDREMKMLNWEIEREMQKLETEMLKLEAEINEL